MADSNESMQNGQLEAVMEQNRQEAAQRALNTLQGLTLEQSSPGTSVSITFCASFRASHWWSRFQAPFHPGSKE